MRTTWLLLLLATGCGPAQAVLRDPGAGDPFQGDTGAPADTGTTADTAHHAADFSKWNGGRTFVFEDFFGSACTDSVTETGTNVTNSADYADALAACPDCDYLYEVTNDPDHICDTATMDGRGIPVASPVVRGIERTGPAELRLWGLQYSNWQGWQVYEMATGPLADAEFTYQYDAQIADTTYSVTGYVDFR